MDSLPILVPEDSRQLVGSDSLHLPDRHVDWKLLSGIGAVNVYLEFNRTVYTVQAEAQA